MTRKVKDHNNNDSMSATLSQINNNNNHQEILEETLQQFLPVLVKPSFRISSQAEASRRRKASSKLIKALNQCLLIGENESTVVPRALHLLYEACSTSFGFQELRETLQETLSKLSADKNSSSTDLLVRTLPSLIDNLTSEQERHATLQVMGNFLGGSPLSLDQRLLVIEGMQTLLQHDRDIGDADNEKGRRYVLEAALKWSAKFSSKSSLLPRFSVLLLELSAVDKDDTVIVWNKLRVLYQQQQQVHQSHDTELTIRISDAILNFFAASSSSSIDDYLVAVSGDDEPCTVDMVLLLVMSRDAQRSWAVDKLFDKWLSAGVDVCSIEAMNQTLACLGSTSVSCELAPALNRLALFLMLAPSCYINGTLRETVSQFFLNLYERLLEAPHLKEESLVDALLQLAQEAGDGDHVVSFCQSSRTARKRKIQLGEDRIAAGTPVTPEWRPLNQRSINSVLQRLVSEYPDSLNGFKTILLRHLTKSMDFDGTTFDKAAVEEDCSLLLSTKIDSSEIISIIKNALQSSSGQCGQTVPSRVRFGLILARLVTMSALYSVKDKNTVRQWVKEVILPTFRRMLHPELGLYCVEFLRAQVPFSGESSSSSSKFLFSQLKELLGNTGLIQKLSLYERTMDKRVLVGYGFVPSEIRTKKGASGRIVFCVEYFLQRNDMSDPTIWPQVLLWIFDLVDVYLEMGRKKSASKWNPDAWLQSAIAVSSLPPVQLAAEPSLTQMELASLYSRLNRFEAAMPVCSYAVSSKSIVTDTLLMEGVQEHLNVLFRFELSLLIAIAMSLAVLRNAYKHSTLGDDESTKQLGMLKHQLTKVYDLHAKSMGVLELLKRFLAVSKRSYRTKKRKGWGSPKNTNPACSPSEQVRTHRQRRPHATVRLNSNTSFSLAGAGSSRHRFTDRDHAYALLRQSCLCRRCYAVGLSRVEQ